MEYMRFFFIKTFFLEFSTNSAVFISNNLVYYLMISITISDTYMIFRRINYPIVNTANCKLTGILGMPFSYTILICLSNIR